MNPKRRSMPSFKAFLSHRYKSPRINEYFFEIFSQVAEVHFEVDIGTKATNVTRLERMVRDSDSFIGMYPYPSKDASQPDRSGALEASRYFRLELDLAIRSGRPSILFIDSRYGNAISAPEPIIECHFDHQELLSGGRSPKRAVYSNAFKTFLESVLSYMNFMVLRNRFGHDRNKVGLVLPSRIGGGEAYNVEILDMIEKNIRSMAQEPVRIDPDSSLDGKFFRLVEELDWCVVDIGEELCRNGIVPYLHGRFIPMLRMLKIHEKESPDSRSPIEETLFGAHEVGYAKDIVRWHDDKDLEHGFVNRLTTLYEPGRRISTLDEARTYFLSASLRKEAVFISYSGDDRDIAAALINVLKTKFQQVFDYRDRGESIVPGRPWIEEIFDRLSTSAVAIPLISKSYFSSGNCQHEAREIIALRDMNKVIVIPIKLRDEKVELPSWMKDIQYIRHWEYPGIREIANAVISAIDNSPGRGHGR